MTGRILGGCVEALQHLGFARVIQDSRTGNSVASSTHRSEWCLRIRLDVTSVDQHGRRTSETPGDSVLLGLNDDVLGRDIRARLLDGGCDLERGLASGASWYVEYGDRMHDVFISGKLVVYAYVIRVARRLPNKGIDSTSQVLGYHGSHRARVMPNMLGRAQCS